MDNLENLSDEELIKQQRYLADRIRELTKSISPLLEEYYKIKDEWVVVSLALNKRLELANFPLFEEGITNGSTTK